MADKSNRLKKEAEEEKTPKEKLKKPAVKSTAKAGLGEKFKLNERVIRIIGLFFMLFSVFLAAAFISHIFNFRTDYRMVLDAPSWEYFADNAIKVENALGKLGAWFAVVMFHHWFGLASFGIPFLLFVFGFRFFFNETLLPAGKTTVYTTISMFLLSVILAYIFPDPKQFLGGSVGHVLNEKMVAILGKIGLGLLLLAIVVGFLIYKYNLNIRLPKFNKKTDLGMEDEESSVLVTNTINSNTAENEDSENEFGDVAMDEAEEEIEPSMLEFTFEERPKVTHNEEPELMVVQTSEEDDVEPELELNSEGLSELDKERMNLKDVLAPGEEFELGEYDPTLDLSSYVHPSTELLDNHGSNKAKVDMSELEANKKRILETLRNYSIEISKIQATIGPTVTLYEIIPAAGVRISKIKNLEDDIALSLSALGIRIIAPMPGKGTVGIEVPNQHPEIVAMKTLLNHDKFTNTSMDLPVALGKTISNDVFIADLAKMPHLLMAGATGQGKSVGLNAILVSLLYKKHPSQIKFVLVDPKKVELTLFNKIERHFLAKLPNTEDAIITDTKKVVTTLNSLCVLMDQRYELLKMAMVRNIKEYNAKFVARKLNPKSGHHFMPYVVLVVDEFADLIMTAGKEVELPIARLAQLARAIGIHLIIATQRPSVNIITGTIKANFPARIAFRVTSKIDSRTILDSGGAEQLIGRGDMLLSTGSDLIRLQCPFVDTPEVDRITEFIGNQRAYPSAFELPEYIDEKSLDEDDFGDASERDPMFDEAAHIIVQHQQGSTSLLQRKLKLGYNRAGRIVDQMEKAGIIGPFEGSKARKVLIKDAMSLEQLLNNSKND